MAADEKLKLEPAIAIWSYMPCLTVELSTWSPPVVIVACFLSYKTEIYEPVCLCFFFSQKVASGV